jgi:hypothetical protein
MRDIQHTKSHFIHNADSEAERGITCSIQNERPRHYLIFKFLSHLVLASSKTVIAKHLQLEPTIRCIFCLQLTCSLTTARTIHYHLATFAVSSVKNVMGTLLLVLNISRKNGYSVRRLAKLVHVERYLSMNAQKV